ncbi:hypothetical protein [Amycolatopsis tolypomycina]|uniref:hypothetical protein n=1 Tax=Amycolatopsis tolypomycina TaxID=208445 RepID=UPI00115FCF75|nr:hypothetical protein [Amycolatopsis tolypomycina]
MRVPELALGWRLYQDAVLATSAGTARLRAVRSFTASSKLGRVHQVVGVDHRACRSSAAGRPRRSGGYRTVEKSGPNPG